MKEISSNRILAATLSSISDWKRALGTSFIVLLTYFFFAFNTNIPWNIDILSSGLLNFPRVLYLGTVTMIQGGYFGFLLKIIYAVMIGVTVMNFGIQLTRDNLSKSSLTSLGPGLLAGGCGCGIGILSIVGLAGATALLPFNGNLLMIAGLGLMLYALNDMGDPEKCDVKVSYSKEE
jgi:hypothetical protein